MGSIIMDNAVIQSNTIIAAGPLCWKAPSARPAVSTPVYLLKDKRYLQDLISGEIERIANNYIKYSNWFQRLTQFDRAATCINYIIFVGL
jgi:hypothetical protein